MKPHIEDAIVSNMQRFAWLSEETRRALSAGRLGAVLPWARTAGLSAWLAFPGRYVSEGLEELIVSHGDELRGAGKPWPWRLPVHPGRHWVHVLTQAVEVGGHTRLVETFIRRMTRPSECHSVVLLEQGALAPPKWLGEAALLSGGGMVHLPAGMSLADQATTLRSITLQAADVVVLHTHPSDPVPLAALSENGGPPVLLYNHADHVFWFNSSIADMVIDLREAGQLVTLSRRSAQASTILPIPLRDPGPLPIGKREARRQLGIDEGAKVLLSVAASYKFQPYKEFSFVDAMLPVLDEHRDALILVVGPERREPYWTHALAKSNGRILAVGPQESIESYIAAADLSIESFPVGSLTASLDSVLGGAPVFRAPKTLLPTLTLDRYDGMNASSPNVAHYSHSLSRALSDLKGLKEMGIRQSAAVRDRHIAGGWNRQCEALLSRIPTSHRVVLPKEVEPSEEDGQQDERWAEIQAHGRTKVLYSVPRVEAGLGWFDRWTIHRCAWKYGEYKPNLSGVLAWCIEAVIMSLPFRHRMFQLARNIRAILKGQ